MRENEWYQRKSSRESQVIRPLCCFRCQMPLKKNKNNRLNWFTEQRYKKKLFCPACEKRDRFLLAHVNVCIRLYGGMISLHDIIDLYDNQERIEKLYFDPFADVRGLYKGRDKLCIHDIHGWVEDGAIFKTWNSKLTNSAVKAREEIQLQQKLLEERKKAVEKICVDVDGAEEDEKESLSRLRESGGASMGKHRWIAGR